LDILHEDLNRADKLANMQQRKAKESKDFTSLGNRSILEEDSLDPQGMNEE
jgi:ubiquitin C-terminal hydrolase